MFFFSGGLCFSGRVTWPSHPSGSGVPNNYIDSSETLAPLLQMKDRVRALESKIAEFRLSQSGGEASVERQLRFELENQSDYTTARAVTNTERRQKRRMMRISFVNLIWLSWLTIVQAALKKLEECRQKSIDRRNQY